MPRVLWIGYDFPPAGGSGVQRAAKMARYLPRHGWQPTVLCCGHARQTLRDDSLAAELPPAVRVVRVAGWEPAGLVESAQARLGLRAAWLDALADRLCWRMQWLVAAARLPESALLWSLAAGRAACRATRTDRPAAVVTSGPPHSAHRVGRLLQRRFGLPWVADLRDPITTNFGYRPASHPADAYWRRLEREIVRHADRVVVTCDALADDLSRRHAAPAERFVTIANGFDPIDFLAPPAAPTDSRFTLTHVGSFYAGQSIEPLLCAVRRFVAARPDLARRFRLRLVGSVSRGEQRHILPSDGSFLERIDYLPHRAAVAEMTRAAALLLVVPAASGGELCIPGKTFEYLATDRPILAAVPSGSAVARLVERAGGATVVPAGDVAALAGAIAARVAALPTPVARDARFVAGFRRDRLAGRYADLLDRLAFPPAAGRIIPVGLRIASQLP